MCGICMHTHNNALVSSEAFCRKLVTVVVAYSNATLNFNVFSRLGSPFLRLLIILRDAFASGVHYTEVAFG